MDDPAGHYRGVDRLLHGLAFRSWDLMVALSGLEDRLLACQLPPAEIQRPVFITALPRAGTTLLLELCVASGAFATHHYRDMPLVLCPWLWARFSALLRGGDTRRERAHGDGMLIDVDSPEAFEEILWKGFWPSRYREDHISPWGTADYPDFQRFLQAHIRKLIHLRGGPPRRYISKNNLNIARIAYLRRLFPDARIVVPFREPLQHAASLQRQHLRFLEMHQQSPFARRYMADIGHFDFGMNLRPVDFAGWFSAGGAGEPETLAFWLRYWQAAYRELLTQHREAVAFFAYDRMLDAPARDLRVLATLIDLDDPQPLVEAAGRINTPRAHPVDTSELPGELVHGVSELYQALQAAAANPG